MTQSIEIKLTKPKKFKLSKREKQNLDFLMQGLPNKAIADLLEISEHTVKVTMWRLFKKIGVHNRLAAVNWYVAYSKNALTDEYEHMDLVARIEKLTRENRMLKSINQASMCELSEAQIASEYKSAGMMHFPRTKVWVEACKWAYAQGRLSISAASLASKNTAAGNDATAQKLAIAA
jgi:DNA-binding CsgD family transcriptional regulator